MEVYLVEAGKAMDPGKGVPTPGCLNLVPEEGYEGHFALDWIPHLVFLSPFIAESGTGYSIP